MINDPNIAQIRPENVMNLSAQQQESLKYAFSNNLAVVVPKLAEKLMSSK